LISLLEKILFTTNLTFLKVSVVDRNLTRMVAVLYQQNVCETTYNIDETDDAKYDEKMEC